VEMASSTPWWSRARSCSFAAHQLLGSFHHPLLSAPSILLSTMHSILTLACLSLISLLSRGKVCLAYRLMVSCCSFHVRSSAPVAAPAASRLQRFHSASGWSSVFHWCCLVGRWSVAPVPTAFPMLMRLQRLCFCRQIAAASP
jgi:hypothetical protein